MSELFLKKIIRQLLFAVKSLHDIGIAHRDLKLDNIMFTDNNGKPEIRVIDFGLSKSFDPNDKITAKFDSLTGTAHYLAPQVIKGQYDEKCDIWALGVITYQLFSGGDYPFDGDNEVQVYKSIKKGKFYLPPPSEKKNVS